MTCLDKTSTPRLSLLSLTLTVALFLSTPHCCRAERNDDPSPCQEQTTSALKQSAEEELCSDRQTVETEKAARRLDKGSGFTWWSESHEPDEVQLSLFYPPGSRRPLWGY